MTSGTERRAVRTYPGTEVDLDEVDAQIGRQAGESLRRAAAAVGSYFVIREDGRTAQRYRDIPSR